MMIGACWVMLGGTSLRNCECPTFPGQWVVANDEAMGQVRGDEDMEPTSEDLGFGVLGAADTWYGRQ